MRLNDSEVSVITVVIQFVCETNGVISWLLHYRLIGENPSPSEQVILLTN